MASTLRRSALQVIRKQNIITPTAVRYSSSSVEKNILTSVYKDVPASNLTVPEFVWQNLDRWPDKTAIVCAVSGRGYTYAQVQRLSLCLGAALRSRLRLGEQGSVGVVLPNLPEYPVALLGLLQAGCVASMINPTYTAEELRRQFEIIECKAVIASKISYKNIKSALNAMKKDLPVILVDNEGLPEGTIKFAELTDDKIDTDCLKEVRTSPTDVAVLPFSSGTTGFPKAVVLTHRSVVAANIRIADPDIVAIQETTATHQSVLPAVLPFFHIFGFNVLMINQMSLGCKLVTLPYFKPDLFLKTIEDYKADALFVVPPMVSLLSRVPPSVRAVVCGAAPLSPGALRGLLHTQKNLIFRQGYGLTETNGGACIGSRVDHNHSSVGHVLGGCLVKIADLQTHEALGPGEEGEIWIKGPILMEGYYQEPAATREVMTSEGWLRTGDLGRYDADKYLYVTDRLKELIKVKGFQVAPAELEAILLSHPAVEDCAVLGAPHPGGELPRALLVLGGGGGARCSAGEVLEHVNRQVADYKRIHDAQIVTEIPRNAAGKILRKDLKAKYC